MDNFFVQFSRLLGGGDEQRRGSGRRAGSWRGAYEERGVKDGSHRGDAHESGSDLSEKIAYVYDNQTALKVSAFYRGVAILGGSLSQMVMEYQKFKPDGDYFAKDMSATRGRRLNYLLQVRPNRRKNASQFWRDVMCHVIFRGNAFIFPRRSMEDGEIEEFVLIEGNVSYNERSGTYSIQDGTNGVSGTYDEDDVIHIRNCFTNGTGKIGIPTLTYAFDALSISRTTEKQTLETSAKGGRLKLLLMRKPEDASGLMGKVSTKEMEKEANKLREKIFTNDVNFIDGQFDTANITMSSQDQQLFENRKFGIPEIARFLNIPPVMLFDYSNSSYKSYEDSDTEYMARSLAPIVNEIECEFNAKLVYESQYGNHRYCFRSDKLYMMHDSKRADVNMKRLQTGTCSVNDLRREENMPTIAGGDEHYVSTNLAVVGSEKLRGGDGGTPASGNEGGTA